MMRYLGVLVLVVLVCGCGAQAAGTSSAPSTPAPKPTSTRPPATPTATVPAGPPFHLDDVSAESPSVDPGAPATLDYTIENSTGANQDAVLGASAYSQSDTQKVFSDSTNDESVTLVPGTHTYRRSFVFPQAAAGQTFDLVASVNTPGFGKLLDEERYSGLITVNASTVPTAPDLPPPPADTPTPSPNDGSASSTGSYTDDSTQMSVTVSHVQGTTDLTGDPVAVFYVQVTNNDVSPHDYNPLDFTCVDDAHQEHAADAMLDTPFSNAELNSGTLAPDDTRAGWVGCNMPAQSKLLITWDDAFNLEPPAQVWP